MLRLGFALVLAQSPQAKVFRGSEERSPIDTKSTDTTTTNTEADGRKINKTYTTKFEADKDTVKDFHNSIDHASTDETKVNNKFNQKSDTKVTVNANGALEPLDEKPAKSIAVKADQEKDFSDQEKVPSKENDGGSKDSKIQEHGIDVGSENQQSKKLPPCEENATALAPNVVKELAENAEQELHMSREDRLNQADQTALEESQQRDAEANAKLAETPAPNQSDNSILADDLRKQKNQLARAKSAHAIEIAEDEAELKRDRAKALRDIEEVKKKAITEMQKLRAELESNLDITVNTGENNIKALSTKKTKALSDQVPVAEYAIQASKETAVKAVERRGNEYVDNLGKKFIDEVGKLNTRLRSPER